MQKAYLWQEKREYRRHCGYLSYLLSALAHGKRSARQFYQALTRDLDKDKEARDMEKRQAIRKKARAAFAHLDRNKRNGSRKNEGRPLG